MLLKVEYFHYFYKIIQKNHPNQNIIREHQHQTLHLKFYQMIYYKENQLNEEKSK